MGQVLQRACCTVGSCEGGRFIGVETGVSDEFAEIRGFPESDREWLGEKVRGGMI